MRGFIIGTLAISLTVGGGMVLSSAHSHALGFAGLPLGPKVSSAPDLATPDARIEPLTRSLSSERAVVTAVSPATAPQMPTAPQGEDTVKLASLGDFQSEAAFEAEGESHDDAAVDVVPDAAPVAAAAAPRRAPEATYSTRNAPVSDWQLITGNETTGATPEAYPRYMMGVYR